MQSSHTNQNIDKSQFPDAAGYIPDRQWWKEIVVYQIYPRSYQDSNGDGIGDLKGIISRLDYIKSLGIDVVWLSPIFASPNDDNGYDISDYESIMEEFGTMEDFDLMLQGLHERGIKLILDLVVNHSSSEHEWFKQSRSSRTNPYRDYYHWYPAENGKPASRFSFFDVNNDAWKYDPVTNAYYLHYFSDKQPDLKWENPQVRKEIYNMMHFWFKKGIDGFRMDVIPFISKDTTYPEIPEKYHGNMVHFYADGPHLHDYLQEMYREVLSKYNCMTVGEGIGVPAEEALKFVDPERKELNMLYHFDGVNVGYLPYEFKTPDPNGFSLLEFKAVYSKWDQEIGSRGWNTIYLGNHDQPRMVTRWGNDSPEYRELSSKMLTTFLLSMRATPYYYAGDEIGMNNVRFNNIEDYQDIETLNMFKNIQISGGDVDKFLEAQKISARDNGRTPFQWDDTLHGGFTSGTPWLKVNPNFTEINAASQEHDPDSILNYFRRMVQVRKNNLALVYGTYELVDQDNTQVYAYTRKLNDTVLLVMLNFSAQPAILQADIILSNAGCLICNYKDPQHTLALRPYEAVIYAL